MLTPGKNKRDNKLSILNMKPNSEYILTPINNDQQNEKHKVQLFLNNEYKGVYSIGYINEKNQLERLILVEANSKLRGPLRIIPSLANKGYSSADVKSVLNRLVDEGEIDFKANAHRLAEKKLPDDFDEEDLKKLLYKNGFNL